MFKKKKTEEKSAESKTSPGPKYHEKWVIEHAIDILNEALESGQLPYKSQYNKGCHLVVANLDYHDKAEAQFVYLSYVKMLPLVRKEDIKSAEAIAEEQKKTKQAELEKLKGIQANTVAEIEKLARELGEKV